MTERARSILTFCLVGGMTGCVSHEAPLPVVMQAESVLPGTIGIVVRRDSDGIVVAGIGKDSPAFEAGLRVGDVLLRYNGVSVADIGQFNRLMVHTPPGSTALVEVLRGGVPQRFAIPVRQIDTTPRVHVENPRRTT